MSAKPRKPKSIFPAVIEPTPEGVAGLPAAEVTLIPAPVVRVEIKSTVIPECPPSEPALGMKTPAVVAWWFEHYPAEAAARYAGLTMPEFPQ
jgi:hypothetical protein